jgi:molybdopterin converting factor small subunit
MPVSVLIPTPLRNLTQNQDTVQADAATVTELVKTLEASYPGIADHLQFRQKVPPGHGDRESQCLRRSRLDTDRFQR